MSLEYFDYRKDIANVLITPEIRARFMRIEPGTTTGSHTHDLGHEIFLVLEGEIEFDVAGRKATLGPGQMCVALVDEPHTLRVIGDKPATIYLSVTPHVEPTHTQWSEGKKLPPRYGAVRDGWPKEPATLELVDAQLAAISKLVGAVDSALAVHKNRAAVLRRSLAAGDTATTRDAVDALWLEVRACYQRVAEMGVAWNQLATRATFAPDQ